MLLPTSPEFLALCQAQLLLLTQSLGADLGIIYLTEAVGTGAETRLVPILSVPESNSMGGDMGGDAGRDMGRDAGRDVGRDVGMASGGSMVLPLALPSRSAGPILNRPNLPADRGDPGRPSAPALSPQSRGLDRVPSNPPADRLVLPLMHEEMVLGLLVTERCDRSWLAIERQQVEQVARTLALACVLDQRSQWLTQNQQNQAQLQSQQHDLMDNLVHQLRNPLTAMRTFGKLLMRRLPETDSNREAAVSIVRESDRLQELLLQIDRAINLNQPLLEVVNEREDALKTAAALPIATSQTTTPMGTKMGTLGQTDLELEPCDVRSILQPLLVSAVVVAQEKNLALHTEFPEVLPLVRVNPAALREVLTNLVDNAVKYTPVQGEVHIRLEALHDQVLLRITDNGGGIPDQDLPQLFQRHFRGVQEQTDIPGTGLGLAIARDLMQQMQGDIRVFSPMQRAGWITEDGTLPEQRGVTFVVTLPIVGS